MCFPDLTGGFLFHFYNEQKQRATACWMWNPHYSPLRTCRLKTVNACTLIKLQAIIDIWVCQVFQLFISNAGDRGMWLAFSMELMVTPAAHDTMRWRSSMSGPISSSTNGMMWGFTARKRTSLLFTVSLLLVVKFTPIFCENDVYFSIS